MAAIFLDTNVVLYLIGQDAAKADRAEELLRAGGIVCAQVLNELASVASRKQRLSWTEIADVLHVVRTLCRVEPLTAETHASAVRLAADHGFSFYDAVIVASALGAGCTTLYTEDLRHGRRIGQQLEILNPFRT